jgi:hypothetical protein
MFLIPMLLMLTTSCAGSGRREPEDRVDVLLHEGGRALRTDGDTGGLVQSAVRSLNTCDGMYELVVTRETIERLRADERCLEITFPVPREVVAGGREKLKILRLLIPMTGRFAERDQMTFFCGFPAYSSGPYLRTEGLGALVAQVGCLEWH